MTRRVGMVSPDVVASDMRRIRSVAADLDQLARVITTTYEELFDASLSQGSSGETTPPGKAGFRVSDPTGDLASSPVHSRMRFQVRKVARKLRKLIPLLEEAEDIMVEAFNETDPTIREKLRRLHELERAARDEDSARPGTVGRGVVRRGSAGPDQATRGSLTGGGAIA